MRTSTKTVLASLIAAATITFPLQSFAHGGHGRWKHEWKHHHHGFKHGGRHHGSDVIVVEEPRYVYREPKYVYREPVYVYEPRRPGLVIDVDLPSVVIPF